MITVVACFLGIAVAAVCGHGPHWGKALATVLLAVLMHAAANVLNDYHDACNGADQANTQGIYPFTGGARLIQKGVVTPQDTRALALALLIFLVPWGLLLALHTGLGLLGLGVIGAFLAWAYSAPPFVLMSRGLGELTVALAWALVVIGADYVQRGAFSIIPSAIALSYGLLIGNVLLINGFPDASADAQANKRTLVVRLGPNRAAWLYLGLAVLAHAWVLVGVWWFIHPAVARWGLVSLPLSLSAAWFLFKYAHDVAQLKPALVLTVLAAVVHGLAMTLGFIFMKLGYTT